MKNKNRGKRPNSACLKRDKPIYLSHICPQCKSELKLLSVINDPLAPDEEIWWDEWVCPKRCSNFVYLDLSEEDKMELEAQNKAMSNDIVNNLYASLQDPEFLKMLAETAKKENMSNQDDFDLISNPQYNKKDQKGFKPNVVKTYGDVENVKINTNLFSTTQQQRVLN